MSMLSIFHVLHEKSEKNKNFSMSNQLEPSEAEVGYNHLQMALKKSNLDAAVDVYPCRSLIWLCILFSFKC